MARRAWGEGSTFFDATKKRWTWRGTYIVNGIKKPKTLTAKRQIDLKKKVDRFKLMVYEGYYADEKNIYVSCESKRYQRYLKTLGWRHKFLELSALSKRVRRKLRSLLIQSGVTGSLF